MSENYDGKLCAEVHKGITKALDEHDARIYKLEQENIELKVGIKNLCKSMDSLISTIKWGLGTFITIVIFLMAYFKL